MESKQFKVSYVILPHGRLFIFLLSRELSPFVILKKFNLYLFVLVPTLSCNLTLQSNTAFYIRPHLSRFPPSSKYTFR